MVFVRKSRSLYSIFHRRGRGFCFWCCGNCRSSCRVVWGTGWSWCESNCRIGRSEGDWDRKGDSSFRSTWWSQHSTPIYRWIDSILQCILVYFWGSYKGRFACYCWRPGDDWLWRSDWWVGWNRICWASSWWNSLYYREDYHRYRWMSACRGWGSNSTLRLKT